MASNMSKDSRLYATSGSLLRVAAQTDALLEVIHGEQVVFPQTVDDAEHDHALVITHGVVAEDLLLCLVLLFELLEDGLAKIVAAKLVDVDARSVEVEAELAVDAVF